MWSIRAARRHNFNCTVDGAFAISRIVPTSFIDHGPINDAFNLFWVLGEIGDTQAKGEINLALAVVPTNERRIIDPQIASSFCLTNAVDDLLISEAWL